jgi:hypothetical protein
MTITPDGKNRTIIFGPKNDGTYVVEIKTAAGETLAISIPRTETAVIRHFYERMPSGLSVPPASPTSTKSGASPVEPQGSCNG